MSGLERPSAKNDPKMLAEWFWTDRWTGSSGFLLPLEARGLYREMLTQAWRRGGKLPNDHEAIRRATGTTAEEWERCWPQVERFWRETEDGSELVNETQVEVYAECLTIRAQRSAAGRAGAAARWGCDRISDRNADAMAGGMRSECPPDPDPDLTPEQAPTPDPTNQTPASRMPATPRARARTHARPGRSKRAPQNRPPAEPSSAEPAAALAGQSLLIPADELTEPKQPRKAPEGEHHELVRYWERKWAETRLGQEWAWQPRHFPPLSRCLKKLARGDPGEVERRIDRLLESGDRWVAENASPNLLESRWNQLAVEIKPDATNGKHAWIQDWLSDD